MAEPAWTGGGTTPIGRADTWVGGASRIAPGRGDGERAFLGVAAPTGVTPAVVARYGLSRHLDLGVRAAGTSGGPEVRYALVVSESDAVHVRLVLGAQLRAGVVVADALDHASRFGAEVPAVLTVNAGGVYEAWIGARVALDRIDGTLAAGNEAFDATAIRGGGLVGLGIGFRALAFALELAAEYESIDGTRSGADASSRGLVLTPSFATRLRW